MWITKWSGLGQTNFMIDANFSHVALNSTINYFSPHYEDSPVPLVVKIFIKNEYVEPEKDWGGREDV